MRIVHEHTFRQYKYTRNHIRYHGPDNSKGELADNKPDYKVRVGRLISLLISPNYFIFDSLGTEWYLIRGN